MDLSAPGDSVLWVEGVSTQQTAIWTVGSTPPIAAWGSALPNLLCSNMICSPHWALAAAASLLLVYKPAHLNLSWWWSASLCLHMLENFPKLPNNPGHIQPKAYLQHIQKCQSTEEGVRAKSFVKLDPGEKNEYQYPCGQNSRRLGTLQIKVTNQV